MLNLTAKEKMLLEDEKSHEQLCVQKYQEYAQKASDPQLKSLFNELSQHEQQHLTSINQILSGTVPNINQGQGQSQGNQNSNMQSSNTMPNMNLQSSQMNAYNEQDKMLCQDSLSTEKYVSSTYNTAIFEFADKNIRQVLNHIQKEEQEHGEKIYNYMSQHNMYN
ncbi:rubrerythrin family protein [[Clostridium] bifermentans ATCC 638]|uniref:Rubrerythrin family protein n=1 Tax=Paraclostridium bifermentans ATCC 638 = DSM 14991 TaxID=1233171 RepID=T4VJB7_PARBF|nr:spore coat protein [Paraclostridium bifermentans]EQK41195.1 rubrerythrin family protein [[Clostridium] bifermentans ATCC 638] [Paraclostridium bifermentans ATCC 638 = DSM 14991]RIZ57883.1 spore coat protein [Paraclostridium bifermentans]UAG18590.1 spore coat protein [Paraclostridium bifermentans]